MKEEINVRRRKRIKSKKVLYSEIVAFLPLSEISRD